MSYIRNIRVEINKCHLEHFLPKKNIIFNHTANLLLPAELFVRSFTPFSLKRSSTRHFEFNIGSLKKIKMPKNFKATN